jgi:hypothetical protein
MQEIKLTIAIISPLFVLICALVVVLKDPGWGTPPILRWRLLWFLQILVWLGIFLLSLGPFMILLKYSIF